VSVPQVARRYARALYEAAIESGELSAVEKDMTVLSRLFAELPEVPAWCRQDAGHAASAGAFVRTAFLPYVGGLTGRTLVLAAQHNRLAVLPLLPRAFEAAADAGRGTVRVRLEAAQPPDAELVSLVAAGVSARTGKLAVVEPLTAPELVAGFRLFWNDRLIDRSALGRLRALRSRAFGGGES